MTESSIKSFSIFGLFGKDDVHITFDENIKILIGENGIGKTQILNIFYYALTNNFHKLNKFYFEQIELHLKNKIVKISKKEIEAYSGTFYTTDPLEKEIIRTIGRQEFKALRRESLYLTFQQMKELLKNEPFYINLRNLASDVEIVNVIKYKNSFGVRRRTKKNSQQLPNNLLGFAEAIDEFVLSVNNILYFPTFRRVEEDLENLGYIEGLLLSEQDNRLINFGMDDVQKRFNSIEKHIDSLLKEGFTKISSEILSKLVKGFGDTNKKVLDRISKTDIDIILARVGNQISDSEKEKIREIVLNKEVSNTDDSLFYFIQTLVEIYEKQKEFDNSVNKFKKICNSYLIGKQVIYDESNIKIYIRSDSSNEPLPLNKLSSGEKQIISIFSKIYLSEDEQRFIVLFDEPELSLSMSWQKKMLPDILASNKCDFLLAVTHSPFIFDNDLDRYAMGLNEYIQPQEKVIA